MVLKEILHIYHKELDDIYGKNEVDSFFNLVITHYLKIDRIHLVLEPNYVVTKTEEQPLFEALSQLKLEQPIQYILGETEFYGLPFIVNEHTLIPRPETEELVALIMEHVTSSPVEKSLRILDIGTGTGCIAISLAKYFPNANVCAMDVSEEALKIAKQNAKLNEVTVAFKLQDILAYIGSEFFPFGEDVSKRQKGNFDIIVSNPPYVRNLEKAEIQPNVLENEPHLALFVDDNNPLQFYKAICEFALENLNDNGILYFEINEFLGKEMIELMSDFGFKAIELKQDMYGKDRMLSGCLVR